MLQGLLQKIIAFIMSSLAFFGLVKADRTAPDTYTEKNNTVEFCFISNPSTGYGWTAKIDGDAVALTEDRFEAAAQTGPTALAGAPGRQYYTFSAVRPGTATVTFTYARSWEQTDADRTATAVLTVAADGTLSVTQFQQD